MRKGSEDPSLAWGAGTLNHRWPSAYPRDTFGRLERTNCAGPGKFSIKTDDLDPVRVFSCRIFADQLQSAARRSRCLHGHPPSRLRGREISRNAGSCARGTDRELDARADQRGEPTISPPVCWRRGKLIRWLSSRSVARRRWPWGMPITFGVIGAFLVVDLAFVSANSVKIIEGGWFPLVVSAVVFTLMSTWRRGRQLLIERTSEHNPPLARFIAEQGRQGRLSLWHPVGPRTD